MKSPEKHRDCRMVTTPWDGYLVLLRPRQNKLCIPVWFLCSLLRGHPWKNQIQKSLKSLSHEIWEVNKNTEVPFCAVRVDIAMEHINRSMKVWTIYNPWWISLKMTQNIHRDKNSLLLALFSAYRSPKLRLFSFIWMEIFFSELATFIEYEFSPPYNYSII